MTADDLIRVTVRGRSVKYATDIVIQQPWIFTPNYDGALVDATADDGRGIIMDASPLKVIPDVTGYFEVDLPSVGDSNGNPTGYTVKVQDPTRKHPYNITPDHTLITPDPTTGKYYFDLKDVVPPGTAIAGDSVLVQGGISQSYADAHYVTTADISGKADASALTTEISNRTSAVTSEASTRAAAVTTLTTAVSAKADASTVSTLSTTVAGKADSSTVSTLSTAVGNKVDHGALVINVRDYGGPSNADGTVDDTSVIDAAYAAIPAGGGRLLFDSGTWQYKGADFVIDKDNVEITGMGRSTTLKFTDGGLHVNGQTEFRWSTRLAQFHVIRAGTAGPAIRFSGGGSGTGAIRWVMTAVHVESSTGPAFSADGSFIGDLFGCYLRGSTIGFECKLDAITGTVGGNAITMHGGEIESCAQGMSLQHTTGVHFVGTTIEGCTTSGITLISHNHSVGFSGCYFELNNGFDLTAGTTDPASDGANDQTGYGLTVHGCFFAQGGGTATNSIILRRSRGTSITGNCWFSYPSAPVNVNEWTAGQVTGVESGNYRFGGSSITVLTAATAWTVPSASANVQTYATAGSFTWTKPAGATMVRAEVIAGGGGGGSGRRGAAASIRCGGGGGSGGCRSDAMLNASDLGSTATVVVGAAGTAGAAVTADSTNGNDGGNGGDSRFGDSTSGIQIYAKAGIKGSGGTTSTGTAGIAQSGMFPGSIGGNGSTTGLAGGTGGTAGVTGGGGAGGGITSADVASGGGTGGNSNYSNIRTPLPAGGTVGAGQDGTAAGAAPAASVGGNGGGGGASSITGAAGAGGAGGTAGGGGAGGGASLNGNNSGAGGAGAAGFVRVTTYF